MKNKLRLLILLIPLASCIESFEQAVPRKKGILLVESLLLDHQDHQYVKLHFTDSANAKIPVWGASVVVRDDEGNEYHFDSAFDGVFLHFGDLIDVSTGKSFRLEINIGDTIRTVSGWEQVPSKVQAGPSRIEPKFLEVVSNEGFTVSRKGVEIFTSTGELPTGEVYLRWTYEESYGYLAPHASPLCSECSFCYITEQPQGINNVTAVSGGVGKVVSDRLVNFVEISEKFNVRYSTLIKLFSITRSAYDYYNAIRRINEARGNIFDPPPAVLKGNLTNTLDPEQPIYGFFEVGRYSETSVAINRAEIPFIIPTFLEGGCMPPPGVQPDPGCSDCRDKPGASKDRPYYF